jgi:tetratricopeptide (TPR) repeat protein
VSRFHCGIGGLLLCTALAANAADSDVDQLIKGGHYKRAHFALEAALQKTPNDAHLLLRMSQVKHAYGDLDAAKTLVEKAISIDPKNADYHNELARVYGDQAQKASVFGQIGLAHGVRKELDAALAADPKHVQAHFFLMLFYLEAPGIAGGDRKKAEEEAATIAKLDAAQGYLAQTEIANKDKKTDQLLDLYTKAHQADPNNAEAALGLCNQYFNLKRFDDVEKCGREFVKLHPDRSTGYSYVVLALGSQKRWQDVDAVLAEAEKNVPDNLSPYFNAGRVIATDGGDLPRGEKYLRKYLSQEPEPISTKPSRAHWRLAQIFEKEGRKPEAVAELEIATRLEPQFKPAADDLKRLK